MVFYQPPPRRRTTKLTNGMANLASLSDELLLGITGLLPNDSITDLRLAGSELVGACNETLATRNNVLYIHPTGSSLKQALDICEHSLFSKSIEEVVLLGEVHWKDMEKEVPQIRNPDCIDMITPGYLKGRYAAWPHEPYREKTPAPGPNDDMAALSETGYSRLFTALKKLPKLHKLAFAESMIAQGWNHTRQGRIKSHAKSCAKSAVTDTQRKRHADVDLIFSMLAALGDRMTSLSLHTDLPFTGPTVGDLRWACDELRRASPSTSEPKLSHVRYLTSLDLTMSIGTKNTEHLLERGLVALAAPSLKHLRIVLAPQTAKAQQADPLHDLLLLSVPEILNFGADEPTDQGTDGYFQKLQTLTLECRDPPELIKGCADGRRPIRPSCQYLDFTTLLTQVRPTLRHVTVRNIVFAQSILAKPTDTISATRDAIMTEDGTAFPHLERFDWRVNQYEHDRKCRADGAKFGDDCAKHKCHTYMQLSQSTTDGFQLLARELDAPLHGPLVESGFGHWDFGDAIMRERNLVG